MGYNAMAATGRVVRRTSLPCTVLNDECVDSYDNVESSMGMGLMLQRKANKRSYSCMPSEFLVLGITFGAQRTCAGVKVGLSN